MNTKDFAIGILSVVAVILFASLVLLQALAPSPAMAFAQNAVSGDYLVSTARLSQGTELLVITDAALQRMNVYGFNADLGQIELVERIDLAPLQRPLLEQAPRAR